MEVSLRFVERHRLDPTSPLKFSEGGSLNDDCSIGTPWFGLVCNLKGPREEWSFFNFLIFFTTIFMFQVGTVE